MSRSYTNANAPIQDDLLQVTNTLDYVTRCYKTNTHSAAKRIALFSILRRLSPAVMDALNSDQKKDLI